MDYKYLRIITASLFLFIVVVASCSKKVSNSFPISCERENPKGAGHSTYGIPQLWSC